MIPIVDERPFMSKVSLIDIGTPNNGGKNSLIFYSESWKVQFLLLVDLLISSHFYANVIACSKLTSVIKFNLSPMVAVLRE